MQIHMIKYISFGFVVHENVNTFVKLKHSTLHHESESIP